VLGSHPHLRSCLAKCRHCQILFLTDPRNRGRKDLGCPFGCRDAHRKSCSNKRSRHYYQTDQGKVKKKQLNDRRKAPERTKQSSALPDNDVADSTTLCHIQMVVSMIEGRSVALAEIVMMLKAIMRQHSMDFQHKPIYKCRYTGKQPP
jgi:hypothetical protein